jgi:CheY-like chemotaxis protein
MDKPKSKTLLFAEDEPELLEIYTHWFQRLGYNVLGASNGNDALAICRTHPIDLVVSDVRMAGGDGILLVRKLKTTMDASPLQRPLWQQNLLAGMGIEILHLEAEALDLIVQWISNSKPRAFIPRE